MKTLGKRIRELREGMDLSLREFAKRLDLSAAFVSDVELGRRHPSDKVMTKMARILETTVEELRTFDARVPVEDMKRLAHENPAYGLAFRRVVSEKVTPEELMRLAEETKSKKSTGKK